MMEGKERKSGAEYIKLGLDLTGILIIKGYKMIRHDAASQSGSRNVHSCTESKSNSMLEGQWSIWHSFFGYETSRETLRVYNSLDLE